MNDGLACNMVEFNSLPSPFFSRDGRYFATNHLRRATHVIEMFKHIAGLYLYE